MLTLLLMSLTGCVRSTCAPTFTDFDNVAVLTVEDVEALAEALAMDPGVLSCEDFCEAYVVDPSVEEYSSFSIDDCALNIDLESFDGGTSSLDADTEVGEVDCAGGTALTGSETYGSCN